MLLRPCRVNDVELHRAVRERRLNTELKRKRRQAPARKRAETKLLFDIERMTEEQRVALANVLEKMLEERK